MRGRARERHSQWHSGWLSDMQSVGCLLELLAWHGMAWQVQPARPHPSLLPYPFCLFAFCLLPFGFAHPPSPMLLPSHQTRHLRSCASYLCPFCAICAICAVPSVLCCARPSQTVQCWPFACAASAQAHATHLLYLTFLIPHPKLSRFPRPDISPQPYLDSICVLYTRSLSSNSPTLALLGSPR